MKNTDLSAGSRAVVDKLVQRGGILTRLTDTNIWIVELNEQNFYFVGDMLPIVPFTFGIFTTDDIYVRAILDRANIMYGELARPAKTYSILVTKDQFVTVLSENTNVTSRVATAVKQAGERVLSCFPHASYIALSLSVELQGLDTTTSSFSVSNITFNLDRFVGHSMYDKHSTKKVEDVIATLITSQ